MGKGKRSRSIVKGALAGLAGGIAGSAAKKLAEKISLPGAGEPMSPPLESTGGLESAAKPWVLGAVAGAVYGAAIEIEPKAGAWQGAAFGLAVRKLTNRATPPRADAWELTVRQTTQQRQGEWLAYVAFGVVTETVRRLVRNGL